MFGIARHMLVRRADQPARVVMRSFAAGSFKASPVLLRERGNPSAAGSRPHGEGQHSTMDKLIEETRKLLVNLKNGATDLYRDTRKTYDIQRSNHSPSRSDLLHVRRNRQDILALVPFFIVMALPASAVLLPIMIVKFPNLLPKTFLSPEQKVLAEGTLEQQRALAKQVIDDVSETINVQTGMPDDGIDNRLRNAWQNICSLHASPNGVLYEHLQTEPLKALVQHVWTINNLNWTQQQRCAKLIGHPAIAFPGSKLPNDLQFILQDDDRIRNMSLDRLSDDDVHEALMERGFHRTFLDDHSDDDRREMLERWLQFTDGMPKELAMTIIMARMFSAH